METNPSQVSYLRHEDKCLFSKENITTEKGLSFMKIYYEEVPLYALIDSGSTISLAGPKLFQQFPSLRQLLKPYDCEALTVCNSTFKFAGQLTFAFSIGQNNFWVCLKYVETMPYSVLLGADFLKSAGINVDFGSGIVIIPDVLEISAQQTQTIEPKQRSLLYGTLPQKPCVDVLGLIVPCDSSELHGVKPGSTVVQVNSQNCLVPVCLVNNTEMPCLIEKGDNIARVQLLKGGDSICETVLNVKNIDTGANKQVTNEYNDRQQFDDQFMLDKTILTPVEVEDLQHVLWEYADLFQMPGQGLGHTNVLKHTVRLMPGSKIIKTAPYRCNPKVREEISKQIQEMLDQGIIRPSESPYASPVVMVTKQDGSLRFCVDFRKLNAQTIADCHPIGRIDDSLDSLGNARARYFSKVDLLSGFWQMELDEDSKHLTAFCCHEGLYEFERLPFGMKNSPSSFARLMQEVLRGLVWKVCLVFVDDIVIFSDTFQQHLDNLKLVFDRFRAANLKLKPKKCEFGKRKIQFLGHLVSEEGVEPLPDTCKAVQNFPRPTNVKQVRSFLGLSGFYRKYIEHYSKIATPLTNLTKKNVPFQWDELCQTVFELLKSALSSPPILAYPRYQEPFILTTDASSDSAGMVLSQVQDGKERVIAYGAKKFTRAEMNYGISDKEALAVILAVRHFEPYLKGTTFKLITDHSALKWMFGQKTVSGRIARWIAYMQQFNYTVEHKAGKSLGNADGLSRQEEGDFRTTEDLDNITDDILPPGINNVVEEEDKQEADPSLKPDVELQDEALDLRMTAKTSNPWINRPKAPADVRPNLTTKSLRKMQLADENISPIVKYLEEDIVPTNVRDAKRLVAISQNYELIEGVLYHMWYPEGLGKNDRIIIQLVLPRALVHDVLTAVHGDPSGGHYGIRKTYHTAKLDYYWRGMLRDVQNWVLSCHHCCSSKKPTKPYRSPLEPLPPFRVGNVWAVDILGPLKESYTGAKYLIVFMEYATKYAECFPVMEIKSHIIARHFVDEIVYRYGAPTHLLSDMGTPLISQVFNEAALMMGTKRLVTTPFRPSTDGMVERFNYSIAKQLSAYVDSAGRDWCKMIRGVVFSYNVSVSVESTHYQPYYLMFGRTPRSPISVALPEVPDVPGEINKHFVRDLVTGLHHAHEIAQSNMKYHKQKMKEQYKKAYIKEYEVGQRVWVYFPAIKVGENKKLKNPFSGPYIITEKVRNKNFRLVRGHDLKPLHNKVHIDRLRPYVDRTVVPPVGEELRQILAEEDELDELVEDQELIDIDETVAEQQNIGGADNQGNTDVIEPRNEENENQEHSSDTTHDQEQNMNDVPPEEILHDTRVIDEVVPTLRRSTRKRKLRFPNISKLDSIPEEDLEEQYEVSHIIKGRYSKSGEPEYLIEWANYPKESRSYEPWSNLSETVKQYIKAHNIPMVGKPPNTFTV